MIRLSSLEPLHYPIEQRKHEKNGQNKNLFDSDGSQKSLLAAPP
jgi:hypothetical protein